MKTTCIIALSAILFLMTGCACQNVKCFPRDKYIDGAIDGVPVRLQPIVSAEF